MNPLAPVTSTSAIFPTGLEYTGLQAAHELGTRSRRRCGHAWLKDKPAQVCILGKIADVLVHVSRIDRDGVARAVRCSERNLVEHALHYGMQAACADILHA